jgi:disulfide bond formation protein DsbB
MNVSAITTEPASVRSPAPPEAGAAPSAWTCAALAVAAAGLAGSLFLSLGMGLKACPLCFYQRTFMMSLVAVLGMGLLAGAARPGRLALLALPVATAGLGVALFHVWLEVRGKLECPGGVLGLGTAPQQSLAAFALVFALLLLDGLRGPSTPGVWAGVAGALILGALLGVGSSVSNPPMPPAPTRPYDKPPDVCRPPARTP